MNREMRYTDYQPTFTQYGVITPNTCSILDELSKSTTIHNATSTQASVNTAAGPAPELIDSVRGIYTTCYQLGCNKEIKRGEVCECGVQN
jgi:hypothetical protein